MKKVEGEKYTMIKEKITKGKRIKKEKQVMEEEEEEQQDLYGGKK